MCVKVCPKACPQKTDMLDKYLTGYYFCGVTLVAVAEQCFVTADAVEKALKRYDKEAYLLERARRKKENDEERKQKDRERKQSTRQKELPYVKAVKKAMDNPIVGKAIRMAIRQHLAQGENEHTAWAATIIAPHSVPHPEPFIAGIPDNMTRSLTGRIIDYE
ncbi:MAG: hypothetical protein AB1815_14370, partial [Bacillota bacterium]